MDCDSVPANESPQVPVLWNQRGYERREWNGGDALSWEGKRESTSSPQFEKEKQKVDNHVVTHREDAELSVNTYLQCMPRRNCNS